MNNGVKGICRTVYACRTTCFNIEIVKNMHVQKRFLPLASIRGNLGGGG